MFSIKESLNDVCQTIQVACEKANRSLSEVKLVAVTKTLSAETIKEAFNNGITIVGENKVQELLTKHEELQHLPLSWHFIGHLQTNKVKYIVDKISLIHSVDRLKLAQEINRQCQNKKIYSNILVQVNVSGEISKFGVANSEAIQLIKKIADLDRLRIKGLMTMAPFTEDMEEARAIFSRLKSLADKVEKEEISGVEMKELSMGMTNDFPIAIEEGATLVRVGSGIFGERQYK